MSDVDGNNSFTPALRSGMVSGLINVAAVDCGSTATARSLRSGSGFLVGGRRSTFLQQLERHTSWRPGLPRTPAAPTGTSAPGSPLE
jgi:hypothetical protein